MTAISTKGLTVHMTKAAATPTALVPTDISLAAPAIVTVADTSGIISGNVVAMANTGFSEIDGKIFIVGVIDATTFELLGSNTVGSTGTLGVSPEANVYIETDMVLICLSALTQNATEPATVSTGTYCDPTTSIPSAVIEAGTLTLDGYVDVTSDDYQELLDAEEDGLSRTVRVTLPNNGYLIAPMVVSLITWDLPLDGAIAYSGTAVLGSKLKHVYEEA